MATVKQLMPLHFSGSLDTTAEGQKQPSVHRRKNRYSTLWSSGTCHHKDGLEGIMVSKMIALVIGSIESKQAHRHRTQNLAGSKTVNEFWFQSVRQGVEK